MGQWMGERADQRQQVAPRLHLLLVLVPLEGPPAPAPCNVRHKVRNRVRVTEPHFTENHSEAQCVGRLAGVR